MNRQNAVYASVKHTAVVGAALAMLIACGSGRSPMTHAEEFPTGGSPSASGGGAVNTGGKVNVGGSTTGGAIPGTGGLIRTGGLIIGTGGLVRTGGQIIGTGGLVRTGGYFVNTGGLIRTGGQIIGTGGLVRTGGLIIGTGGLVRTGGLVIRTGGMGDYTGGRIVGTGGTIIGTGGVVVPPDAGTPDTPPVCSPTPFCDIFCPTGYRLDSNGCPLCACNPVPDASIPDTKMDTNLCPPNPCPGLVCPYGFITDPQGCPTCRCSEGPNGCPPVMCKPCPYGLVVDQKGCYTCECIPDPSIPCNQFTYSSTCKASTRNCQWLTPGCDTPAMTTSGCFDPSQLDCDGTCPNGLTCLKRSVNPCPGSACEACGKFVAVCL